MSAARKRILAALAAAAVVVVGVVAMAAGRDDGGVASDVDVGGSTSSSADAPDSTSTSERAATSTTVPSSTTVPPVSTTAAPTTAPQAAPPPSGDPFASVRIRLTRLVSLDQPIAMAVRPTDRSVWIALKGGSVCRLSGGSCPGAKQVAAVSAGSEQGLLGIAFDPSGSRLYASYTDPAGDSRVDELAMTSTGAIDTATRRNVFEQDQPEANHNGGNILFGPDGRLWLGLGDGGGAGDQHGAIGNAQNPGTDLGKILRIDPATKQVERWISGVRNPWRFSFDRATGDLWVADVGQSAWEEITFLPAGAQRGRNLGWRCYEGTHAFTGCNPSGGHTAPILEYSHSEGCSITGGYVYRGSRIPALRGAYLFSDYCAGELRGLTRQGGEVRTQRRLGVDAGSVFSFGEDAAGELYVLTPAAVLRIDPA